jgi:hypoxanthine phosphoribosyltransferase
MKITTEKAVELSRELAQEIDKAFTPDVVIGIKEGGILPAVEVAHALERPVQWIKVSRVEGELEDKFNEEYRSSDSSKRREVSEAFDEAWFKSDPEIVYSDQLDLEIKKVLIVDDAVHSGKTLGVILKYLSKFNPSDIKTAALFYVDKRKPDFFVGTGEHKYPWSTWAKFEDGYIPYQEYLEKVGNP